jgi:hypothetical protein
MTDKLGSEKLTLGFLADVLYLKGVILYEEFEAIQSVKSANDLETIVERMLTDDFNQFKRGEHRIITAGK